MSKLFIGIGIVINSFGEVLIDQRKYDQIMGGLWEFPGGKQEKLELINETIKREIFEELEISVEVCDKLVEFDYPYKDNILHFVVHICKWKSGLPKPIQSLKCKWVKPEQLINYNFPPANIIMINALKKYLLLYKNN